MGEEIWRRTCPSLRNVRNLLDMASKIAKAKDEPKITIDTLREAYTWVSSHEEKRRKQKKQPPTGTHEQQSEQRHEGKGNGKKENGDKENGDEKK